MTKLNRWQISLFLAAACLPRPEAVAATRITLSTNMVCQDVERLGINISDNYWDAPILKKRAEFNFEGLIYRQTHNGDLYTDGFTTYWGDTNRIATYNWDDIYTNGATFRIISGEAQGVTGRIVRIEMRSADPYDNNSWRDMPFFVFDKPIALATNGVRDTGILIENFSRTDDGYLGVNDYWKTAGTTVITTDRAPGSFGVACARLDGSSAATVRIPSTHQRAGDANGDWHLRFWARRESGSPTLTAGADSYVTGKSVTLSDSWQKYDLTLTASGVPTPAYPTTDKHVIFRLMSGGSGSVLIDDVEFWKEGQTNSTPFSDDALATLRKLNPGIVRFLRMGGNTVTNAIVLRLRQFGTVYNEYTDASLDAGSDTNYRKDAISLHEQAELCEELGSAPWFCLPGGIYPEEVAFFTDYLGGDTNTPGGSLRAELGHPQPWTDVFDKIYVEFGNEAWNTAASYLHGGFNGGDYWKRLIAAGKSSASYQSKIIFQAAGQNYSSGMASSILGQTDNADRYAIAPYMLFDIRTGDLAVFSSDEELFQWMMAHALYKIFDNGLPQQGVVSSNTGVEYSIYEYNYHSTEGDFAATLDTRNRFLTSQGHAVSIGNSMLAMLKEYNIRSQCFFTLNQFSYNGLRLWGNVISSRADQPRYRPAFHAMELANKVLQGDLVETVQSGSDPSFTTTGDFESAVPVSKTYKELYSYAFKEGATNGLVIASYNLETNRQVELVLPEYVAGTTAACWILSSSSYTNSNEPELSAAQVDLQETVITNFENGIILDIPPASLTAFKWTSQGAIPQITPSTDTLYVPEGTVTNLTVVLSSAPAVPLTVSASVGSQQQADFRILSGGSLSFNSSNWNIPQTITLTAAEDAYGTDGSAVLVLSAEGCTTAPVSLTEIDDDPSGSGGALSGTLLFDFGSSSYTTADPGWNNVTSISTGIAVTDALNSDGTSSGYALEITDAFQYILTDAAYPLPGYPNNACRDYFRVFSTDPSAAMKLTGMSPALKCTVSLLANGTQNYGSETRFTVGGVQKVIDSYYNLSTLVVFTNVAPSPAGEISIGVDYYGSGVGILNLMKVDYAEPVELEDSDGDGMPDWWEDMYGFGPTGAVPAAVAANGINTLTECYIAGLDPTDPADLFRFSNDWNVLWWNAVSGRVYSVYWTSNLLSGFQTLESNLTTGVFTNNLHSTSDRGFYRIDTRLAPE